MAAVRGARGDGSAALRAPSHCGAAHLAAQPDPGLELSEEEGKKRGREK